MKAWLVKEKDADSAEVVFAETRGKARSLAKATDACSEADFVDIEVRRMPQADKYYKEGKWHLDFDTPNDRIVLVKECGFRCEYIEPYFCEDCAAKEYCDYYQDFLEEQKNEEDWE